MKKKIIALCVLTLLVSMVTACGKENDTVEKTEQLVAVPAIVTSQAEEVKDDKPKVTIGKLKEEPKEEVKEEVKKEEKVADTVVSKTPVVEVPVAEVPVAEVKVEAPVEIPVVAPVVAEALPSVTLGQKNALSKASIYLSAMSFSYSGLIVQLQYEGFTIEEATYAVDNCGANWSEQASKKAQIYLGAMSFSKSGLIEQLLYDGFTQEQAEYGVVAVGY